MKGRWRLVAAQPEAEEHLVGELGISPLLARLLANRGLTSPAATSAFLGARLSEHLRSPLLFRDMGRAAERIVAALQRSEPIGIYGDYDVDGISGSALLVRFLRALGGQPLLYIPHRLREGYGLSEAGVRHLAQAGARVMVTVDCGAGSHGEVELAKDLGLDVIVCDHHQVSETRVSAHAVLNPADPGGGFPFAGLCGAGVAFYLALGVRMRLREAGLRPLPDLRRYLDLVALGTIADVVPVIDENRVLVKYGLREMAHSDRPGIVALKAVSGVTRLSTGAVGFRLAPRLNAGGRLADARRSVELLTTDDRQQAERLAAILDEENSTRRSIERRICDEAVERIEAEGGVAERRSIVLASADWHPGVIGIVAARLVERYYRPTVLISLSSDGDLGRGSGRSISGLDLHAVLGDCRDRLVSFGGHPMAVGLSLRPADVAALTQQVEVAVTRRTRAEDFIPVRWVDGELPLPAIDAKCVEQIDHLEPCGPGNRQPVFIARDVLVETRKTVGGTHLKLSLKGEGRQFAAIGFGMADRAVEVGDQLDILYTPMLNEWNGRVAVELRLRDLRPRQPVNARAAS